MEDASNRLGCYRILREIGRGSNAIVKLGEHTLTGARVALKYIEREWIRRMGTVFQTRREIRYLRLLRHPHVIKLYEVITTATHIILVQEYAQDELFDLISRGGRLTEEVAKHYFQQMMYALAYSHSLQVVHRDLKPENILLAEDTTHPTGLKVKIADFGLSNEWSDGDWLKTGCGTPHYAAPEIISGQLYGNEVDVWSAGAILYVMCVGRLPYDDDNMAALFHRVAKADYRVPEDLHLSDDLLSLISGMMTVDPMKRLSIAQVLAHPWTRKETPKYLRQIYRRHMIPRPQPIITSLTTLLESASLEEQGPKSPNEPSFDDFAWDAVIVQELSKLLRVRRSAILNCLNAVMDNAVKVAYAICADRTAGYDLAPVEENEVVVQLAAAGSAEPSEMILMDDSGAEEEDPNPVVERLPSTIAILTKNGKLIHPSVPNDHNAPDQTVAEVAAEHRRRREQPKLKPERWHFGIRSMSSPMEVMVELYKSLQALGIEWREKRGPWLANAECCTFGDSPAPEDQDDAHGATKEDLDIYTVEIRWRKRDVVALMKLRLYKCADDAYTVDFVWLGHYRASILPDAPRFEREDSISRPPSEPHLQLSRTRSRSSGHLSISRQLSAVTLPEQHAISAHRPSGTMNPFLFFECACELIAELTGVGADPLPPPLTI